MRILVAGASTEAVCGTRDAARTLAEPLARAGAEPVTVWWERRGEPFADWAARLAVEAPVADAVLWHYSPFTYSYRGLPTLVRRTLRALGGRPLVPFFHELTVAWGDYGLRGAVWAPTQRAALVPIVRAACGCVVTTEERERWLDSRRWLPDRPTLFVPVHANVAEVAAPPRADGPPRVGVFGFRRDTIPPADVVGCLPGGATLVLVGAPGPGSPEADEWRAAAAAAGVPLELTGVLNPSELSAALHSLDVVLVTDPRGPSSRRGTLAAVLAHGRPIVAVNGPETWRALVDEDALVAVPAAELGAATAGLVADEPERAALGRRARAFHDEHLAPDLIARSLVSFVKELL